MKAAMATLGRGTHLAALAWVHQVHGGTVLRARGPGLVGDADALWTTEPGLATVGRGADCPLVLVGGRLGSGDGIWGFAHASWRSTVAGITGSLLAAMTAAGLRPETARAVICPSAGPCCYEVGGEVRSAAVERLGPQAAAFFTPHGPRWLLDLWAANEAQLGAAGRNVLTPMIGSSPVDAFLRLVVQRLVLDLAALVHRLHRAEHAAALGQSAGTRRRRLLRRGRSAPR
jgi:copper oxidase (laccase) domain-containing protein